MQATTGEGQRNLAPLTIQLEMPSTRPQLQRQNGVVEDRSEGMAPPSGQPCDVLPPAPFPQILGVRPATPALLQPPPPALANSDHLIQPTSFADLIQPPTSTLAMPMPNQPTSTLSSASVSQLPAMPSTSGIDPGLISLPPFPTLRPDLAALMNPEGEMDQASGRSTRGVKRSLEATQPAAAAAGKETKKSR